MVVGEFALGRVDESVGDMAAMVTVSSCTGGHHPCEVTGSNGFGSSATKAGSLFSLFRRFFFSLGWQHSAWTHVADLAAGSALAYGASGHGACTMKRGRVAFTISYLKALQRNSVNGVFCPVRGLQLFLFQRGSHNRRCGGPFCRSCCGRRGSRNLAGQEGSKTGSQILHGPEHPCHFFQALNVVLGQLSHKRFLFFCCRLGCGCSRFRLGRRCLLSSGRSRWGHRFHDFFSRFF